MNDEDIKQRIEEFRKYWWHYYKLPNGIEINRDDSCLDGSRESIHYPENVWDRVKDQVPDMKDLNVLDIGCNAGWFSLNFCKQGANVLGIDINQDNVSREAQCNFLSDIILDKEQKTRANFMTGDFLDLLALDFAFDIIWFFGVYYHLPDHKKALPKIASMLRQGGLLFLESALELECREIPHDDKIHKSESHFIPSREYLKDDLRENGFEILWTNEQNRGYAGQRIMIKARKK